MKILLTSTSFMDTPGQHHDLLDSIGAQVDTLRGPVDESVLLPIIAGYDAVVCGDDEYTRKVLTAGRNGKLWVRRTVFNSTFIKTLHVFCCPCISTF